MERIVGPISGCYVAAFTVKTNQGSFGYAKLCARRPAYLWDGTPALAKVEQGPFLEEVSALVIAVDQAVEKAKCPGL